MFFPINCVRNKTKQSDQILSFNFLKINLFIYLFLAVLSLRCFARAFSGYCELGLLFIAVPGLLTAVVLLLQSTDSRRAGPGIAARGLQSVRLISCSAPAQLFHGMWNLPRSGVESMSSALAGSFLFTAPPGKSHLVIFDVRFNSQFQLEMYIIQKNIRLWWYDITQVPTRLFLSHICK